MLGGLIAVVAMALVGAAPARAAGLPVTHPVVARLVSETVAVAPGMTTACLLGGASSDTSGPSTRTPTTPSGRASMRRGVERRRVRQCSGRAGSAKPEKTCVFEYYEGAAELAAPLALALWNAGRVQDAQPGFVT